MGQGIAAGEDEDEEVPEEESAQSTTLETMFNALMFMFSTGLLIMTAFQLVIMCYLYLLGPVAAAFYAWPSVQGKLFRSVFGNWVNAVITVSLWRFYWMIILLIMVTRITTLGERGSMLLNLQWEMAVMTCLIGLMFYIPMNPWNFNPGQAFRTAKFYGESMMEAAKGQQGGGGGGGGQQSAGKGGGGQNTGGEQESGTSKQSPSKTGQPSETPPNGGQAQPADGAPQPSQQPQNLQTNLTQTDSPNPPPGFVNTAQPAGTPVAFNNPGQPQNGSGNPPISSPAASPGQGTGTQPSTSPQPGLMAATTPNPATGAAGQNNTSTDSSRGTPPVPLLPTSVASNSSPSTSNTGTSNNRSMDPPPNSNNTQSNPVSNPDQRINV